MGLLQLNKFYIISLSQDEYATEPGSSSDVENVIMVDPYYCVKFPDETCGKYVKAATTAYRANITDHWRHAVVV